MESSSRRPSTPGRAVLGLDALGILLVTAVLAGAALPSATHAGAATAAAAPGAAAGTSIEIANFKFGTPTLTVPVGTTVTWINHDDELHTVTSSSKVFASPGLEKDEQFAYAFTTPGTYSYFCALHPQMTGTIIVK